ncbi:MAG: hypothetical protein AVDCRST_MAG87-2747, partial [uncultured Thermomicrobiales bacterium]
WPGFHPPRGCRIDAPTLVLNHDVLRRLTSSCGTLSPRWTPPTRRRSRPAGGRSPLRRLRTMTACWR